MSSAEVAARQVKILEQEDWRVLLTLERALNSHEAVHKDYISGSSRLHEDEVTFRLKKLHHMGLIGRGASGHFLISAGLDAIALNSFVKKGLLSGFGKPIGIGKESDVYEAIGDDHIGYAVKFYRIGRISFRSHRRKRPYVSPMNQRHWLLVNIQAAKREFEALTKLHPLTISVPKVLSRERHAILMEKVDGERLVDCRNLENPVDVLKQIMQNIRSVYVDGGLVNADLSEYNILFDSKRAWIIDWPQTVDRSHPNASMLLDRDIFNILNFFRRRHGLECSLEPASFYVRGWRDRFEIF